MPVTMSVPKAGKLLFGYEKSKSYALAKTGEIRPAKPMSHPGPQGSRNTDGLARRRFPRLTDQNDTSARR